MQMKWIFDTSWEVCNKVGGIYAVLSTKAKTLQKLFKDKVVFVGPDLEESNTSPDFEQCKTGLERWRKAARLPMGITVRVGRWNIPGRPIAVLVKFRHLEGNIDDIYGQMWQQFGVDSLHGYGDYDEACAFAVAAAIVIESITREFSKPTDRVVAQFEEWTTGMGLLHLKLNMPQVRTVFTTHATSIGRSIAGNGKPLYDYMNAYNGDQMAQELNMVSKHSLEKAAAHAADEFTTVSGVTAHECEQLLQRRPMVTPNAFEQHFVPKGKSFTDLRRRARQRLLQVAHALTGASFDDDTMLVATSGRCEYRNKGIDVYLDALNVMRTAVDADTTSQRKVVAFVLVPSWMDAPRGDLLEIMENGSRQPLDNPIITHSLHCFDGDVVIKKMHAVGFNNRPGEKLFVIDVPCYLDGQDGIINLSYYDVLVGLDVAVFPSYYEPWGYTPLESAAFAVPTITTNLAGFGQWVLDNFGDNTAQTGVTVLNRTDSNYNETVHALAHELMSYYDMRQADKKKHNRAAQATAKAAQWRQFIKYYLNAYGEPITEQ